MSIVKNGAFRTSALCAAFAFTPLLSIAQSAPSVLLVQAPQASAAVQLAALTRSGDAPAKPEAAAPEAANAKRWSIFWGWNRSNYSKSDIHFTGTDHDFTLRNVEATDLQTDVSKHLFDTYLNPSQITIPQTNVRLAYQLDADSAIALNLDHMKYVVVQDQTVPIEGQILGVNQAGEKVIADNWLNYEHTDGLNILSLEYEKQRQLDWFGGHRSRAFVLVGLGVVLPKSNVTMHMVNQVRNDEFHLAGYDAHVGCGLEVDVYKDVFLRTDYKFGYVNLPDVLTSARGDKASQRFTYNELLVAIGLRF